MYLPVYKLEDFYLNSFLYHIFTSRINFDVLGNYYYKSRNNFELFFFNSFDFFFITHSQLLERNQIFLYVIFFLPSNNLMEKKFNQIKKTQNYHLAYYNNFQAHQNYFGW